MRLSLPSLRRRSVAVLVAVHVLLAVVVHVLERVRPLYRQLAGVHEGQAVLPRVQPGFKVGLVLCFPLRVVLAGLVHLLQHLEGEDREDVTSSERRGLAKEVAPHFRSVNKMIISHYGTHRWNKADFEIGSVDLA